MKARSPGPSGTRPPTRTLRQGDGPRDSAPTDTAWRRRRTLGIAIAIAWLVAGIAFICIAATTRLGPVDWIEAWQVHATGRISPVTAVLPLLPLPFAPALALLLPSRADHPIRLGIQQAYTRRRGPAVSRSHEDLASRTKRTARILRIVAALAALSFTFGLSWAFHAAGRVPSATRDIAYAQIGSDPRSGPVHVLDVTPSADSWSEAEIVRGRTRVTAWRELVPPGPSRHDLFQSSPTGVMDTGQCYETGPTARGRLMPLDPWTADRLREAGFEVAPDAMAIRTASPEEDVVDGVIPGALVALLGAATLLVTGAAALGLRLRTRAGA